MSTKETVVILPPAGAGRSFAIGNPPGGVTKIVLEGRDGWETFEGKSVPATIDLGGVVTIWPRGTKENSFTGTPPDSLLPASPAPGGRGCSGGMSESREVQVVFRVLKESGLLHWDENESAVIGLARDIVWAVNNPKK
jgi:hypothetical protein